MRRLCYSVEMECRESVTYALYSFCIMLDLSCICCTITWMWPQRLRLQDCKNDVQYNDGTYAYIYIYKHVLQNG